MSNDELAEFLVAEIKRYVGEVADQLRTEFDAKVKVIPLGRDGKDGRDGIDGKDADIEPLRKALHAEVASMKAALVKAVETMPTPKDGRDGRDGKDGKDGIGKHEVAEAVEHAFTLLAPDLVSKAVDTRWSEVMADNPPMTYKQLWREGADYRFAHTVTHGGSLWHCNVTGTTARPGTNDDWTLVAKRGRDGRDAKP